MKNSTLEKELKYSLNHHSYTRLLNFLGPKPDSQQNQTNTYFDTLQFELRQKKIGLRIRLYEGKRAELTLKAPAKVTQPKSLTAYKVRKELNLAIALPFARKVIAGSTHLLEGSSQLIESLCDFMQDPTPLERVCPFGSIQTTRKCFSYEGYLLELDRFQIHQDIAYELEIEHAKPNQAHEMVVGLFQALNISILPETRSKLSRLMKKVLPAT